MPPCELQGPAWRLASSCSQERLFICLLNLGVSHLIRIWNKNGFQIKQTGHSSFINNVILHIHVRTSFYFNCSYDNLGGVDPAPHSHRFLIVLVISINFFDGWIETLKIFLTFSDVWL